MPSTFYKSDFGNKLGKVEILLNAIKEDKPEDLAKLGIANALVEEAEQSLSVAKGLNQKQEDLKAKLKAKTAELDKEMATLTEFYSKMKKKIKADVDSVHWKRYGIEDKH